MDSIICKPLLVKHTATFILLTNLDFTNLIKYTLKWNVSAYYVPLVYKESDNCRWFHCDFTGHVGKDYSKLCAGTIYLCGKKVRCFLLNRMSQLQLAIGVSMLNLAIVKRNKPIMLQKAKFVCHHFEFRHRYKL